MEENQFYGLDWVLVAGNREVVIGIWQMILFLAGSKSMVNFRKRGLIFCNRGVVIGTW